MNSKTADRTIFYAVILIFITSCTTIKDLEKSNICEYREKKIINKVLENNIKYKNVKVNKINFEYNDGKNELSLKGWMKISKDSIILISLSPGLGIEVARIYICKDTMYVIQRMDKTIYKISNNYIRNTYSIELSGSNIENIILGNLPTNIIKNKRNILKENCDNENGIYSFTYENEDLIYRYFIENSFYIKTMEVRNRNKNNLLVMNYGRKNGEVRRLDINAYNSSKSYAIKIELNKIDKNESGSVELKLPEKYTIINL